jgi:hypothetical protein
MVTVSKNVVILARTQMKGHVCIGAFDSDSNRYIRLLTENAENQNEDSPYQVGQVYSVEYENREGLVLPHCEDVCVQNSCFLGTLTREQLQKFLNRIAISNIHIRDLFDGALNWEHNKAFLLKNSMNLPNYSVVVASLNHDLFLSKYDEQRFYYIDGICTFTVPYVGVNDIGGLRKITAGRYVRFSLARWWDGNGNFDVARAYLQLSAVY